MRSKFYAPTCLLMTVISPFSFAQTSEIKELVEQEKNDTHWSGLPIWGDEVREMGYELPVPVGFGLYMNSQDVEYIASNDFKVDATGGMLGGERWKIGTLPYPCGGCKYYGAR